MGLSVFLQPLKPSSLGWLFILSGWLVSAASGAQFDTLRLDLLRDQILPLRWYNIAGPPEWLAGAPPRYHWKSGMRRVTLEPGEAVTVQIGAGTYLRAHSENRRLAPKDLAFAVSQGRGLYANLAAVPSSDGRDLVLVPRLDGERLIRVQRPKEAEAPLAVALFVSHQEFPGALAPFRENITLPTASVRLKRADEPLAERYGYLSEGTELSLDLTGPKRLALYQRLPYPAHVRQSTQSYSIEARLDGQPWRLLAIETRAEHEPGIRINGRARLVSRLEKSYLELPPGRHRLNLRPNVGLYLRLMAQDVPGHEPLGRSGDTAAETTPRAGFQRLAPSTPLERVSLKGPLRLLIRHRPTSAETQNYTLSAQLDEGPWHTVAFSSRTDEAPASDHHESLLSLPSGTHQLRLRSSAELALDWQRLWLSDYLFPELNAPKPRTFAFRRLARESLNLKDVEQSLAQLGGSVPADAEQRARAATILARQGPWQDAGMIGAMLLFEAAESRPDAPEVAARAREYWHRHSFYRDLLPVASRGPLRHRQLLFTPRTLVPISERKWGPTRLVAEQLLPSLLNEDPVGGRFVSLPADAQGLDYTLPAHLTASRLRLAVVKPQGQAAGDMLVRFDESPPIRLSLRPEPRLPTNASLPTQGGSALAILGWQHDRPGNTLEGPFALYQPPALWVPAGVIELPVPRATQRLRISSANPEAPIWVAAQYRVSRPFTLTELAYRTLQEALTDTTPFALLIDTLHRAEASENAPPGEARPQPLTLSEEAKVALHQHWLPLKRYLEARHQAVMQSVAPPSQTPSEALAPLGAPSPGRLPPGERRGLQSEAEQAEQRGDWLAALEFWTELARSSDGTVFVEAQLGRATALERLGEYYLLDRFLRGLWLYGTDDELRQPVLQRLLQLHEGSPDPRVALGLRFEEAKRDSRPEVLATLIPLLQRDGRHDLALTLGLALPPEIRPSSQLILSAWLEGYGETLETLLASLPALERRRWQGYLAQIRGDYPQALALWRNGEQPADRAWAQALTKGMAIRKQLDSSDPEVRQAAVPAWEQWQAHHPGPHAWAEAPDAVAEAAGAATLYDPASERSALYYEASEAHPVRLHVQGPLRLLIEARPLHRADTDAPQDGWLRITEGKKTAVVPISDNLISPNLALSGDSRQPGTRIFAEQELGPELHVVDIMAEGIPLLARVFVWRPQLPLAPLPPLTPETLAAAVGDQTKAPEPNVERRVSVEVLTEDDKRLQLPTAVAFKSDLPDRRLLRSRPAVAVDRVHYAGTKDRWSTAQVEAQWPLPAWARKALALPREQVTGDTVRQAMAQLLWEAERGTEAQHTELAVLAAALAQAYGQVPDMQSMARRLLQQTQWELRTDILSSAGVRWVPITGWQPETPSLRIRKTLLPPFEADEEVLLGREELGVSVYNRAPRRFALQLRMEDPIFVPRQTMTVWYRLDDGAARHLLLSPARPERTVSLRIPQGEHTLRLGIERPVVNQLLRLRLREDTAGRNQAVGREKQRLVHLATREEPLRLRVMGPLWLRIDERRGEKLISRYEALPPGPAALTLVPQPRQREALFRLQSLMPAVRDRSAPRDPPKLEPPEMAAMPPVALSEAPPVDGVILKDRYALGKQQAGTWSLGTALVRSRPLEEDTTGVREADEYLQLDGDYRHFAERWRSFLQAGALYRPRLQGKPSYGLAGRIDYLPSWANIRLWLGLEGFFQKSGDWAYALYPRLGVGQLQRLGAKVTNEPEVVAFARILRQGDDFIFTPGKTDQDVFTTYKSLHPRGLTLADTLAYRPWLDTQLRARLSLTSDEEWRLDKPDNLAVRIGLRQRLGAAQLDLNYRWTRYFAEDGRDWQRPNALNRSLFGGGVHWEFWWPRWGRGELTLEGAVDLNDQDYGLALGFRWYTDRGRLYRDFRPDSLLFRQLRSWQAPLEYNNEIVPLPAEGE